MEYTYLGKSGLKISKVILGCMSYGAPEFADWMLGEKDALPLLKAAYDAGINTWDTANVYSNGESERLIAKAIEAYKIPRRELVIMTKCFGGVGPTPASKMIMGPTKDLHYINHMGLSRTAIFSAVDDSLARLGLDYIDLLQIHRCDKGVSKEETMTALHDLVRSGKVRYIGASSMWAWEFAQYQHVAELKGLTKFVSMQNQYNLIYREEEREMIPFCKDTGVGIIPWGPVSGGKLSRPVEKQMDTRRAEVTSKSPFHFDLSDADQAVISRVEELAKKKNVSMSQVAMAWTREKGTIPIVGISKLDRLEEAVASVSLSLTKEEVEELEAPYVPQKIRGHF